MVSVVTFLLPGSFPLRPSPLPGRIGEQPEGWLPKGRQDLPGNKVPSDTSFTASAFPPTSVATIGSDDAIASMMALEKPSLREGRTKMSAAARCCRRFVTPPSNGHDSRGPNPERGFAVLGIGRLQHIAGDAKGNLGKLLRDRRGGPDEHIVSLHPPDMAHGRYQELAGVLAGLGTASQSARFRPL